MSAPIGYALDATGGGPHWFLGARVTYKTTRTQNGGGPFLAEFHAPRGHASPLHVHTAADEMFYVLNGQLTIEFAGERYTVTDGGFVYAHAMSGTASGSTPRRLNFLVLTNPAGFEDFVRAVGEPASAPGLPTPTAPDIDRLVPTAAEHGIQIIGPPLEDSRP